MCLGVPALVIQVEGSKGIVKVADTMLRIGMDLVDGVKTGDYVLVHAGFAIQIIDPVEAETIWDLIKEMAN